MLNVKTHSDPSNSATIVISGTDDLRHHTNFAAVAATADAQPLAAAAERLDAHDRIEHHVEWRAVAPADLLKYAFVDTLVRRLDAREAAPEWPCTADVHAAAGAVIEQPAVSAEKLQSTPQQRQQREQRDVLDVVEAVHAGEQRSARGAHQFRFIMFR